MTRTYPQTLPTIYLVPCKLSGLAVLGILDSWGRYSHQSYYCIWWIGFRSRKSYINRQNIPRASPHPIYQLLCLLSGSTVLGNRDPWILCGHESCFSSRWIRLRCRKPHFNWQNRRRADRHPIISSMFAFWIHSSRDAWSMQPLWQRIVFL